MVARWALRMAMGAAFGLVTGEQPGATPAVDRGGELPGQIEGFGDPRVHTVAAGGRELVRRVADQEAAAGGKPVHD